ncbi:MAG TPA: ABC transporter substrate-binding protein [Dissulfurispiraceae bacterium]|nr:ABC transporter substrate-binding protein [Dissulfurispiraceae bacterium]
MSKAIRFISVFIVITALAFSAGTSGAAQPYKIGVIVAATGSASFLGEPEKNTFIMLADQINKAGGINGHPLEVIVEDSKSDETQAVLSAKKLLDQDNVLAILGPSTTGESMAIIPILTKAQTPMISVASGAVIVQPVSERYWIFKTPQNDSSMIETIYTYIKKHNITKVGIMSVASSFGDSSRKALLELAPKYGVTVVADERYGPKDADMTTQLVKLKAAGAQAIVNMSIGPSQLIVTKNWAALKMGMPLFHSHGWGNRKNIELTGKASEGVLSPSGRLLVWHKLSDKNPQKKLLKKYAEDYTARYNTEPAIFGGHAYDAFYMVVEALKKVGPDKKKIRDYIETKITNWPGTGGVFKMSPGDHCGLDKNSMDVVVVKNGDWEIVK